MSASRDKNQKFTFVYSNLYQIYRKGNEAASSAVVPSADSVSNAGTEPSRESPAPLAVNRAPAVRPSTLSTQARVLKAADVQVEKYEPVEFVAKRIAARPAVVAKAGMPTAPSRVAPHETLESLKDNLKSLNDLHARLKFMLQELEELVKKS